MARKDTRKTGTSSRRKRVQRVPSRPAAQPAANLANGATSGVDLLPALRAEPVRSPASDLERSRPGAPRAGSLAYRRRYGAAAGQAAGDGLAALSAVDYSYIRRDLRRIALLAGAMFAILVILSFWLR